MQGAQPLSTHLRHRKQGTGCWLLNKYAYVFFQTPITQTLVKVKAMLWAGSVLQTWAGFQPGSFQMTETDANH